MTIVYAINPMRKRMGANSRTVLTCVRTKKGRLEHASTPTMRDFRLVLSES